MGQGIIVGIVATVFLIWNGVVAQAGFQIGTRYLDDRPFDPDVDILALDEGLYLSIWKDVEVSGHMEVYEWTLVCDRFLATISSGEAGPDAKWGVSFCGSASELRSIPQDEDGQWGRIAVPEEVLGPGLYLDGFVYKPLAVGDVTVRFYSISSSTGEIKGVPGSIVIHQVPEPITLALFALGASFLHRRAIWSK